MSKELIEAGVWTIISHTCTDCAPLSLCLVCALSHKHRNPSHQIRQSLPKSLLQSLLKKANLSPLFEQVLSYLSTERVMDQVDQEMSKLLATMKQLFKIQAGPPTRTS
jgi:hypothetical protein